MDALVLFAVAATVWLGVVLARWDVVAGACFGAGASLLASLVAAGRGGLDGLLLFRTAWWIGLAELLALGILAGWSTRVLAVRRLVPVLLALGGAVLAMSEWRQQAESNRFLNSALLIALAGCIGAGLLLRQSDRERAVAATQARQDERLAIARELHDVVAHHVTGMVVQAQAGQLVAAHDPARAASVLASIEQAGSEALTSMRRMVGALRTDGQDDAAAPTAPAATLAELVDLAARTTELGLPVHLAVDTTTPMPADVAQSVHRIVREALTNAQRHATGATEVVVRVERRPSSLDVVVADDGRSRTGTGSGGFGLVGMAERVHALGGTFAAGPRVGGGWEVRATFPLLVPSS